MTWNSVKLTPTQENVLRRYILNGGSFLDSEHSADSPASGLSGPTTCSEAERSEAGDKSLDLEVNSHVRRRSEAEPPNADLSGAASARKDG